ncbi:MAG: membrane dipeptidase [Candidatus Improbicoccus pseudotrichonymphae]|uniref:Membrane dipeptidase n=1 Tax=Candidatus Improbicoccus pseudotrichonymphae TaxID=3033792 RepID=A0AA48KZA0_9FIRM|nr:MAG: membrane dipeptidase [Candidatus Improbicoccus pseudotrichonymphae]
MINLFDLHCDTIHRIVSEGKSIRNKDLNVNVEKLKKFDEYIGVFAIWIPPEFRGRRALDFFLNSHKKSSKILKEINSVEKRKAILSVEGGSVLSGNLKNIDILAKCNIKILTLTWNGSCEIGDGICVNNSSGLTNFGKKTIEQLKKNKIIIDISHASEKLFYDVLKYSGEFLMASHSNSRHIFNHKRNLTDEQFNLIRENNGIVGINFCKNFLSKENSKIEDIFEHVEHFVSLSGENTVCIGSDFDGAEIIEEIDDISKIHKLYDFMLKKNYKEKLIRKIFFYNALNFFKKFDII